jgi:hypothetical protein
VIPVGDRISADYLESQKQMHANPRGYGQRGDHWAGTVVEIARKHEIASILDYGCGAGSLAKALERHGRFVVREYDPAIPGKDGIPSFADMVVCTDVLEHIEPDKLDNVLAHIRMLTRKVAFVVIATRPANKCLPNGENAHLIIENGHWWRARVLGAGFTLRKPPRIWPAKMPGKCWVGVLKP